MARTVTELVSAFEPQMSPEAQELITNWTKDVISRTTFNIVMSVPGISQKQMEAIRLIAEKLKEEIV